MGNLNRIPTGFLDLVRATTGGRNPFEYSESVSPVIDFTPFYLAQRKDDIFESATISVEPITVTVPQDECWWLFSLAMRAQLVSSDEFINFIISLENPSDAQKGNSNEFRLANLTCDVKQGSDQFDAWDVAQIQQPIILVPGEKIVSRVLQRNLAAQRVCTLSASVFRMRT